VRPMRIVVLGAGPGGLYFGLLAKKANPQHDITVIERNPRGATYGWGVVFSEETLGALRDADRRTYDQITESFALWSSIDVRFRGETVRSRGHAFSGLARKALLDILTRRCEELGVRVEFERDVTDLSTLPEADLTVASDGVHSLTRERLKAELQPTVHVHGTKFVWFGTDRTFTAFTFVFRENEHGLFQVHAYPFDAHTSTFIVETPEETWRRAGLDQATEEESIAYCEKLFAEELAGHSLLSNRSLWVSFVTLKNETWHQGRTVLLGDAAHTAHFTIGSGTKLAMEDAISLVEQLDRHDDPDDLEIALTHYEMDRQPVVERFQLAALESASYFEHVSRYASFEPLPFAFNLLTRSGRITYLELERRDPAFVATVDGWFAGRSMAPPPMFTPLTLGSSTLPNRVATAQVGEDDCVDGMPSSTLEERLRQAGRSGAGLVVTEFVSVSADGRITPGSPSLDDKGHAGRWAEVLRGIDAMVCVRLGHAGARGATRPRGRGIDLPLPDDEAWPLVAASDVPYARWGRTPRALTEEDLDTLTLMFARAARLAAEAGFAMAQLDLSHGYLLAGFLSPLTNRREDAYGGSLENRMRYPLRVVDAVREAWPSDRPLAIRLTATDWARGGLTADGAVAVALALREHGCDLVEPVAGQSTAEYRPDYRRLYLVPFADHIRNEAGIATMVGGGVTTADEANTILAAGRGDLCLLDWV
jgi:anthraniloyl-CoA monooxygenase